MQDPRVGKRPIRSLSIPEKMEAITRVRGGESKASVARDIGVPESTLRGWCKAETKIRNLARRTSSPNSNPTSPASSNGTEPVANPTGSLSSGEEEDLARPGPSKRRRTDNGHAVPSTSSYSPTHNTEPIEIKPKLDYVNNLISSLMGTSVRGSENSILLQQLAAQNAANLTKNLIALQNNGMASGLVPQTVGLVENGLQYTKSSNGHSNKRHSLATASHYSAIAPTTQMDSKASRKSLPAAAEAPATPVPASPRKTNEYQNGVVGQQHAYQSTSFARSSKKDSNSTATATTSSANINGTSTSSSSSLFQKSDEALWLWLAQQQHLLGHQNSLSFNHPAEAPGSWFWQWYKQCSAASMASTSQLSAGAGSSSGRSTPTPAHQQQTTSTPLSMRSPTKAKAVLDRILYSNNNNNYNNYNDETENGARRTLDLSNKTAEGETATEPSEAAAGFHNMTNDEAIFHGQKFAAWLANASDPAVTQLYVMQIKYLLNKLTMERPTRAFKHSRK